MEKSNCTKPSTFGFIPNDWSESLWGDVLTTFTTGATPYRGIPAYYEGTENWISSGELNGNKILKTKEHISAEAIRDTNLKIHQPGTFLMAITGLEAEGTRGKCGILGVPSTTNQSCLAINSTDKMSVEFVLHVYKALSDWYAFKYSQGTKQQSYKGDIVKGFPIIHPTSVAEQKAIAEILNNTNSLIYNLEKVIAKKKRIKEGAMQELLTGKVRLRGFNEPWVELELGNIGKLTGAGVDKTINEEETPVRLLNFLDIYNRDRIYPHELNMWVTASDYKISQCDIRKGDIFLTPSSELPDDIGRSAVAMADINDACYSYHILRLRPAIELDLVYSAYMLKTSAYEEQIRFLSEGSGKRYVISLRNFREIRISIPSDIEEQHAIGQVIAAMDNEISALEAERDKYISIKQGMMQKLLTGQIRLPQSCLKEE